MLETYSFFSSQLPQPVKTKSFQTTSPPSHHKTPAPLVRACGEGQVVLITRDRFNADLSTTCDRRRSDGLRVRTKARRVSNAKLNTSACFFLRQTKFVSLVIDNCLGQLFCALQYTEVPFPCYSSSIISYANIPLLALILLNISMAPKGH